MYANHQAVRRTPNGQGRGVAMGPMKRRMGLGFDARAQAICPIRNDLHGQRSSPSGCRRCLLAATNGVYRLTKCFAGSGAP